MSWMCRGRVSVVKAQRCGELVKLYVEEEVIG